MAKEYTLKELAHISGAVLVGDPSFIVSGVGDLSNATPNDVSFLANPKYYAHLLSTNAGAICIDQTTEIIQGKNFLVSKDPSRTFQCIIQTILSSEDAESGFSRIHSSAVVHPTATIAENVFLGPNVVIDKNVYIGKNTKIFPGTYVGSGSQIGEDCLIYSNVSIREQTVIGDRVILQPGAVIGSCGFGYIPDEKGAYTKLEQLGIVVIEDDVEIGACSTIDRARFKETRICRGTKIDNLVQIGHNVTLGENNILVSQVGIAGSSKTGKNVVVGGQVGIIGHLEIADYVMISSGSGVSKSITEKGAKYGGAPAVPHDKWRRKEVHLNHISEYAKKIKELEKRIKQLEAILEEQQV
ncbi:MAG: UDP-3-O-(3-hydroxymyristoyl)glucosamine N-acyltransferase [Simkaniaceae bacterium]